MNAKGGVVFFFIGFDQNRRCLHSIQKQRPRCVQNKGHIIFLCTFAQFIVEIVRKARRHTAAKDQHRCCGQNIFDSANNIQGGFTIKRGAFFVELCHAARRCFKQLDVDTDISGDGDKFCIHIFLLEEIGRFSIRMAQLLTGIPSWVSASETLMPLPEKSHIVF